MRPAHATPHLLGALALLLLMGALPSLPSSRTQGPLLPYDVTHPVMYDNDWSNDYADWYLMALASAGDISLRGISTSSPIAPHLAAMSAESLDEQIRRRVTIVELGRASGFRNIPDPMVGPRGHLVKPASGHIEDTIPLDSPATRALIAEAHKATATKPLVVCLGGPLTLVADAYLLDPSIADKVVAAWIGGSADVFEDYNGWADGWAAYIVLERMRLVQFPINHLTIPRMTRDWIRANLPDGDARHWMLGLELDMVNEDSGDVDGVPIVSVRRADYIRATRSIAFAGWTTVRGHEVPIVRWVGGWRSALGARPGPPPNSRTIQATMASGAIAAEEYRRAFTSLLAWNRGASAIAPR